MASDEPRARYLASRLGVPDERLDLIRTVLERPGTWAEPPPQVLDGVLGALAGEAGRFPEPASAVRPRWPLIAALIGSAVAVVALVVATASVLDAETETVLAMTGTELEAGAEGTASVRPTDAGWWIRLDVEDLPPAPQGSYYEGWVWSDEGEGVSIGTFHLRGGESPVVLWSGVEMSEYPSIWVTLEDESDGPEASDRVVMTGRMPDAP